jgi:hypothetical protein
MKTTDSARNAGTGADKLSGTVFQRVRNRFQVLASLERVVSLRTGIRFSSVFP